MNTTTMINLGELALQFGTVYRVTLHQDGVTRESDTTHTVMLGLIAMQTAYDMGWDRYQRGMIAQYVMVHDLVEARCGDTNSFDIGPEAQARKKAIEEKAMEQLREEFSEDGKWIVRLIDHYERQEDPEARLVRYLDKAMPKITHILNNCVAIKAMGKTHEDLVRVHRAQLADLNKKYPELAEVLSPLMDEIMKMTEDVW